MKYGYNEQLYVCIIPWLPNLCHKRFNNELEYLYYNMILRHSSKNIF